MQQSDDWELEGKLVSQIDNGPFRPDLGIIVVLRSEWIGVKEAFTEAAGDKDFFKPDENDTLTHLYFRSKIRIHGFHVVVCLTDEQGSSEIPEAVSRLTKHYGVFSVVLIGVSGSLNSKDLGIGHVVVADSVVDYAYRSSLKNSGDSQHFRFNPGGRYWSSNDQLVQRIRHFELANESSYREWATHCTKLRKEMICEGNALENLLGLPVACHVGPVAAGVSVVKGSIPKESIQNIGKTLLAVDTESHALADQMKKLVRDHDFSHVQFLILRAISDPADDTKDAFDKCQTNPASKFVILSEEGRFPHFQIGAAYNAASFLVELIKNKAIPSYTNQLVEKYQAAVIEFDRAKSALEHVKNEASDILGRIACDLDCDHIYALNKDKTTALMFKKEKTVPRSSVTDFREAIEEVLSSNQQKKVTQAVNDRVNGRPKKECVSVKLKSRTQVNRMRKQPTLVDLPESVSDGMILKTENSDISVLDSKRGRESGSSDVGEETPKSKSAKRRAKK